jgi:hypothetical protein
MLSHLCHSQEEKPKYRLFKQQALAPSTPLKDC